MRALVVVDMQNLFVQGLGPEDADRVVAEVNARVAAYAEAGRPVVYTRDVEPIELPEGDPEGVAAMYPGLDVRGPVVEKGPGRWGGMSGFVLASTSAPGATSGDDGARLAHGGLGELAVRLREAGADAVEVVGLAADVCVAATARDAVRLGYAATVPLAATAFVHAHPAGDEAALAELAAAGVTIERD